MTHGTRAAALLALAAIGSVSNGSFSMAQEVRPGVPAFDDAVRALVEEMTRGAPPGVTVDTEDATPAALGWRASAAAARARTVVCWAPSGACRAYGLMTREGIYEPLPPEPGAAFRPDLVAIGPDLVCVRAPVPPVGLTREAIEAARPLLDRADARIRAWASPIDGPVPAVLPPSLQGVVRATYYRSYVTADLADPPRTPLDLAAVFAAGIGAVAYRYVREGSPPEPFTIAIRPR